MKDKTENELTKIAQHSRDNEEASKAMRELKERFDPTYCWCADCDFLVIKSKDCCMNKI